MKLLIFPGGGSPENEHYRKVYDLLVRRAPAYGYTNVEILKWPGHADNSGNDPGNRLTLGGATRVARERLRELDTVDTPIHVLGRSFGAIVAAHVATMDGLACLKRVALWGPPPYWLSWKLCLNELDSMKHKFQQKGMFIDSTYHSSLVPIEALLTEINIPTVIATGTKDPYSPPAFLEYLKFLTVGKQNVSYRPPVISAPHEVTEELDLGIVDAYCEAVLA